MTRRTTFPLYTAFSEVPWLSSVLYFSINLKTICGREKTVIAAGPMSYTGARAEITSCHPLRDWSIILRACLLTWTNPAPVSHSTLVPRTRHCPDLVKRTRHLRHLGLVNGPALLANLPVQCDSLALAKQSGGYSSHLSRTCPFLTVPVPIFGHRVCFHVCLLLHIKI